MKKVIIAQLSLQGNKTETFLSLAKTMVINSNSEEGCITYKLLKVIDKNTDFFIYEEYESEKAVELHNTSEHFKNFMNLAMPLLAKEPTIETF